jgi:hypothetical protein
LERDWSCHPLSLEADNGPRVGAVPLEPRVPSHPRVVSAPVTDVREHDRRADVLGVDLARVIGEPGGVLLGCHTESRTLCDAVE